MKLLKKLFTSDKLGTDPTQDSVQVVLKRVAPFLKETRDKLIERDMMVPRRIYFFMMFAYGAFDVEGCREGFDEGKRLAVLMRYLDKVMKIDERDIPTILGHLQRYRGDKEGGQAYELGQEAYIGWGEGDASSVNTLRDHVVVLGLTVDNF